MQIYPIGILSIYELKVSKFRGKLRKSNTKKY